MEPTDWQAIPFWRALFFSERAGWIISEETDKIECCQPDVSMNKYSDIAAWEEENRNIVMKEIKRRDREFYDKWCDK